jgi:spore coat assembly protein
MEKIDKGDIVARKSYNGDILFKVKKIYDEHGKEHAILKGLHMRLCANAPLDDLVRIESGELAAYLRMQAKKSNEHMNRIFTRREKEREFLFGRTLRENKKKCCNDLGFDVPGTVLHIDGDSDYLDLCMTTYKQLKIPAHGYCIDEEKQPGEVGALLRKHAPDLLVLTGHDGYIKGSKDFRSVNNYYSSEHFIQAIKVARRYEKSRDDLVIFAGACQSYYEALLTAGANFASSPQRVMIHAYDPVFVVEKIAYTSIYDPIPIKEIINGTITGFDGIGGMETRGKYRIGIPKSPY